MNKQWIGDDHDVRKYCLLRFLHNTLKCNIAINWMLSEKNNSSSDVYVVHSDGNDDYTVLAQKITNYRIKHDTRNFNGFSKILTFPHTTFVEPVVEYSKKTPEKREAWFNMFNKFVNKRSQNSIVFFDPNNGIEVASMSPQTSINYILYGEITKILESSSTSGVLIYQHARLYSSGENQIKDIDNKCQNIKNKNNIILPIAFLGGQKEDGGHFEEAYILLLKDDTLIKQLESNFANIFKPEFLKIHKPCPTPLKTN